LERRQTAKRLDRIGEHHFRDSRPLDDIVDGDGRHYPMPTPPMFAVLFWMVANGAPEEIRTPDPQIRSLGRIIEIVEVCYHNAALETRGNPTKRHPSADAITVTEAVEKARNHLPGEGSLCAGNSPPEKFVLPSAGQPDKLRRVDNLPKCWAWKPS